MVVIHIYIPDWWCHDQCCKVDGWCRVGKLCRPECTNEWSPEFHLGGNMTRLAFAGTNTRCGPACRDTLTTHRYYRPGTLPIAIVWLDCSASSAHTDSWLISLRAFYYIISKMQRRNIFRVNLNQFTTVNALATTTKPSKRSTTIDNSLLVQPLSRIEVELKRSHFLTII